MPTNKELAELAKSAKETDDAARVLESMSVEDRMPYFAPNGFRKDKVATPEQVDDIYTMFVPHSPE